MSLRSSFQIIYSVFLLFTQLFMVYLLVSSLLVSLTSTICITITPLRSRDPSRLPPKENNNYKITDPPEMFFSRFHLTGFVQVDLAFIIPLDLTVDRLPSWPRISISFSAMLADPGSLETMVHFSVGYVHWVSTLVVLKVMV